MNMRNKQFIITKKIAKHGDQAVIIIPRLLEQRLKPGTITKITLQILTETACIGRDRIYNALVG